MKTLHIKTLFGLFILFASTTTSAEAFSGAGDGLSADTAFIITTCEQLQEMNGELDAFYKLGNDIDCSETATWNPNSEEWVDGIIGGTFIDDPYFGVTNIGTFGFEPIGQAAAMGESLGFTGTLDGQGHTISSLWIFRKEQNHTGLIGYATNATVRNLTLSAPQIVGADYTGGFLGKGSNVTLQNLTNTNGMVRAYLSYDGGGIAGLVQNSSSGTNLVVTGGSVHGSGNVIGGLVGQLDGSSVSSSTASTTVDGGEHIGGAFGRIVNSAYVNRVAARGNVDSNDSDDAIVSGFSKTGRHTGGFAGYIESSLVENSSASGSVTAEDGYAGGFAGSIVSSAEVYNNTATGNVSASEYVGGFAGQISGSAVEDSTAEGDVDSVGDYAGGFAGLTQCGDSFLRVAAYGDVAAGGSYAGGFTGFDACEGPGSAFNQAAAHGDVQATGVYVGGFIGYSSVSTFTNAYAGGNVNGNERVGGFAGYANSSTMSDTYSRGTVVAGDGAEYVGASIGEAVSMTIATSFADSEVAAQPSTCGAGTCTGMVALTTADAKNVLTYSAAEWDLGSVWELNAENEGYPHFIWEDFTTVLPGSGTEEDPYQISQCFTIRQSGYYELQNNIYDVYGNCIEVEANNVLIDGADFAIDGTGNWTAIYSQGYDGISISNIVLADFQDGIRINNNQGPSTISNVTVSNMDDDGIELRGVTNMTVSDVTITNVGDNGLLVHVTYDDFDEPIYNSDVELSNLTITDTGEYGIYAQRVTGLIISESQISETDDDGISMFRVEDIQILDSTLDDIGSDAIYIENGADVRISGNTISNVPNADGIDFDDDYDEFDNHDITITDNTLTNIGDNGIEAYDLHRATITGNTIVTEGDGFDVGYGSEIEFRGNTITPVESEFYRIPRVTTESVVLDFLDADNSIVGNYGSFNYKLPFTFNFKGRDIVAIEVGIAGSIELLEKGEWCQICGNVGPYARYLLTDTLFASFDAFDVSLDPGSYVAVFSPDDERVVMEWIGTTQADSDPIARPVHFQVELYPNGEVQWNFVEMNFSEYYYNMFTGAYDVASGETYRVGLAINEPSSYRADLSGETEYDEEREFNLIEGIDLDGVTDSSFIGNIIHANRWVTTYGIEDVIFNDDDSGNTYRLSNGAGAWTIFDIVDTDGNGYAESGTARPFSEATLGDAYWNGDGEDAYPASEVTRVTENNSRRRSSRRFGGKVSDALRTDRAGQIVSKNDEDGGGNEEEHGVVGSSGAGTTGGSVTTTRQLQRFLNTNGFPVASSGPGSLNNETDTFGELTRQALARFQQANGISPALGIFGPITKAFINKNASGAPAAGSVPQSAQVARNLEMGASGSDVTAMQNALIAAGFPIASGATGYFGQQTKDALIAYQKANNITPASGYFGPTTRAELMK